MPCLVKGDRLQAKGREGRKCAEEANDEEEAYTVHQMMVLKAHGDPADQKAAKDVDDQGFVGEGATRLVMGKVADQIAHEAPQCPTRNDEEDVPEDYPGAKADTGIHSVNIETAKL